MNRTGQLLKMTILMFTLGVILGGVAGFLVGFVILLSDIQFSDFFHHILSALALSGIYGSVFGGLYGGISGLISGTGMALVTAVSFREIRNVNRFRFVMGLITAIITIGIFVMGGLWSFGFGMDLTWTSAMILSVVIAVYASQIVSKKYFNAISLRKRKVSSNATST